MGATLLAAYKVQCGAGQRGPETHPHRKQGCKGKKELSFFIEELCFYVFRKMVCSDGFLFLKL